MKDSDISLSKTGKHKKRTGKDIKRIRDTIAADIEKVGNSESAKRQMRHEPYKPYRKGE